MSETPFPVCGIRPGQSKPFTGYKEFPCLSCPLHNPMAVAGKTGLCSTGIVASIFQESKHSSIFIRPFTDRTLSQENLGPASNWLRKWGLEIVGKWMEIYSRSER